MPQFVISQLFLYLFLLFLSPLVFYLFSNCSLYLTLDDISKINFLSDPLFPSIHTWLITPSCVGRDVDFMSVSLIYHKLHMYSIICLIHLSSINQSSIYHLSIIIIITYQSIINHLSISFCLYVIISLSSFIYLYHLSISLYFLVSSMYLLSLSIIYFNVLASWILIFLGNKESIWHMLATK